MELYVHFFALDFGERTILRLVRWVFLVLLDEYCPQLPCCGFQEAIGLQEYA